MPNHSRRYQHALQDTPARMKAAFITLLSRQLEGGGLLRFHKHGMGLGKTFQLIGLMLKNPQPAPILVLVLFPPMPMWESELRRVLSSLTSECLDTTATTRRLQYGGSEGARRCLDNVWNRWARVSPLPRMEPGCLVQSKEGRRWATQVGSPIADKGTGPSQHPSATHPSPRPRLGPCYTRGSPPDPSERSKHSPECCWFIEGWYAHSVHRHSSRIHCSLPISVTLFRYFILQRSLH